MVQQIWLGYLDARRSALYYGRVSIRMQRWHQILSLVAILSSTAAFATVLAHLPPAASAICLGFVGGSVGWMYVSDFSKKAAETSVASQQLDRLAIEWKQLWFRQGEEGLDALSWASDLERRDNEITSRFQPEEDIDLHKRCANEAYAVAKDEFMYG